jgi:hypothetical protein
MKYVITFFAVLGLVSCTAKVHLETKSTDGVVAPTTTVDDNGKVATTVVFRELSTDFDLPAENLGDVRYKNREEVNAISSVSDKLLSKGIFTDTVGFLKSPLYNNWKTVGPIHNAHNSAKLVEARFDGPRPDWFNYRYAEQIMDGGRYYDCLGFHDLVNLVAKYGDQLPSDVPIIALGSVTAYRSVSYMDDGNIIQSPTVVKRNGKWELWDLRIIYDRSFLPGAPYHPALYLVDVDNCVEMAKYRKPRPSQIRIFVHADQN